MIRTRRIAEVAQGRMPDAVTFAKKIADHLEASHGIKITVVVPVAGKIGRVAWIAEHRDLAEMEARMNAMATDAKYLELVRSGLSNWVPGSVEDEIWRSV